MAVQAAVHEKGTFSFLDMLRTVRSKPSFQKAGAITLFIGVVREETKNGERVRRLELEAQEGEANRVLRRICSDLREREGVVDVQIHPMLGEFHVGEDLVYVLVAGSHRKNLFPVLEEALERYERDTPIFKKEYVMTKEMK